MLRALSILILLSTVSQTGFAKEESVPGVETLMTVEDFEASGLDKLSPAERLHLSAWVARYREGAVTGPPPEKTSEQLAEEKATEMVAKVVPSFTGWSGKTVFRLDNGQTWQQRQTGKLHYDGDDSTVIIYRNLVGRYMMKHNDTGRAVGVKRIK